MGRKKDFYQSPMDRVFQALGDPTRRQILEFLTRGPCTPSELADRLVISLAAVMQQLELLQSAGLVSSRKEGRTRTCRLEPQNFQEALRWIEQRKNPPEKKVERFSSLLRTSRSTTNV